jgi:hypothetical protein
MGVCVGCCSAASGASVGCLVGGSLRLGLSSGFVSGLCLVGVRGGVVVLWVGWLGSRVLHALDQQLLSILVNDLFISCK